MDIDRKELMATLRLIQPGIDKNSTNIDGMDCFIFMGDRVFSFDDAIFISAPSCLQGDFAVPAIEFYAILSKFKAESISIEPTETGLEMKCGRAKATISFRKDDVSKRILRVIPKDSEWQKMGKGFAKQLHLCYIPRMQAQISDKFGGIFIEDTHAIASDNSSITRVELPTSMERMWLSPRAIDLVTDIEVTRYCSNGAWVHFDSDTIQVSCRRQMDDKYPAVMLNKMLDDLKATSIKGTLSDEFYDVIDRASIFAKNTENSSTVNLTFEEGAIIVRSTTHAGSFEERYECEVNLGDGECLSVYASATRLKQVFKKHEKISFCIGKPERGEPMLYFVKEGYEEALGFYKE